MTSKPFAFTDPSQVPTRKVGTAPRRRRSLAAWAGRSASSFGCSCSPSCPPKSGTRQHRCRRMPSSSRRAAQRRASPTSKPQLSRVLSSDQACFPPLQLPKPTFLELPRVLRHDRAFEPSSATTITHHAQTRRSKTDNRSPRGARTRCSALIKAHLCRLRLSYLNHLPVTPVRTAPPAAA